MNYTTNNFIKYCEETDICITNEGVISDYIKKRREKKKKKREENEQKRKIRIEENKKLEAEYKPILMKITKDFIQEFNRNSIRYIHCSTKLDNHIEYYSDLESDYIEADIAYYDDSRSSDNAIDEHFECLKKSKDNIMKKYKKEFDMYDISFDGNSCNVFIIMNLSKPKQAKESFIEYVTESAKDMKNTWTDINKQMDDLRHKINDEEDISTIKKMLSEYISLIMKLKSDIESLDYSSIDNAKYKIHKLLAKSVPLLTFIGTFAGITILNKKAKDSGFDDLKIGGITKFTLSASVGVATALKIGSPRDIKKYYLSEIEYLIKEVKIQQKLMDALLAKGIRTMSEVADYDVEFTSSSINITKRK